MSQPCRLYINAVGSQCMQTKDQTIYQHMQKVRKANYHLHGLYVSMGRFTPT